MHPHTMTEMPPTPAERVHHQERFEEWREFLRETDLACHGILRGLRALEDFPPGPAADQIDEWLQRGEQVIRNRVFIAETLQRERILEKYQEIVGWVNEVRAESDQKNRGSKRRLLSLHAMVFDSRVSEIAQDDILR